MARQKDPVCGMQVEEERAAGRSKYRGRVYYFCFTGCKEKFDAEPEKYAGEKGEERPAGQRPVG